MATQDEPNWHHALQQARCRYPGGCDRAMQWINGYCDEHKALVANLTELFHNSLTNRGKQVLANQAVEDLERQDSETP